MENNNIITAPSINDPEGRLMEAWVSKGGSSDTGDFYKFMTTPSPRRDEILSSFQAGINFVGDVICVTYNLQ